MAHGLMLLKVLTFFLYVVGLFSVGQQKNFFYSGWGRVGVIE